MAPRQGSCLTANVLRILLHSSDRLSRGAPAGYNPRTVFGGNRAAAQVVIQHQVSAAHHVAEHLGHQVDALAREHRTQSQDQGTFTAILHDTLGSGQGLPNDIITIRRVTLVVEAIELAGKYPGTGDEKVAGAIALAALGDPLAAFQVQLGDFTAAIRQRLDPQIHDHISLGAAHRFLCLALTFPAGGRAGDGNHLVAAERIEELIERLSEGAV